MARKQSYKGRHQTVSGLPTRQLARRDTSKAPAGDARAGRIVLALPTATNSKEAKLPLLDDIHHPTFITADMDRLISFYERVFEARTTVDLEEEGLRHA
jgi:hypothetical protein